MLKKTKQIRLSGKKLATLVKLIYERDKHKCVVCGKWVEDGHKPHHVVYKSHGGSDVAENMVLLCDDCHFEVHHGANCIATKDKIERYLAWMSEVI